MVTDLDESGQFTHWILVRIWISKYKPGVKATVSLMDSGKLSEVTEITDCCMHL